MSDMPAKEVLNEAQSYYCIKIANGGETIFIAQNSSDNLKIDDTIVVMIGKMTMLAKWAQNPLTGDMAITTNKYNFEFKDGILPKEIKNLGVVEARLRVLMG